MAISETEVLVLTRKAFLEEIPADMHVSITQLVAVLLESDKTEREEFAKRPLASPRKASRPAMFARSVSMNSASLQSSSNRSIQKIPSADSVDDDRSEERRVGKECVSRCRYR